MWPSIYMTIYICILTQYITNVSPSPLLSQSLEMLDEVNDAEIYRAVVNSISEWERKKERRLESARIKRQDTSVCYQELGCFESSGPFGYLDMLPSTPEEISTKFLLYPVSSNRRRSGSQPAEVPFGNITDAFTWSKKGFNSSLPTKIMIHGFGSDCSHIWVYEMRSALLTVEDVNVICVDWANGATLPNYVKASANTRLVGKQLAILLKGLVDNIGLSYNKMHLIGFSLGAHVAGFAGAELGNLSRITGLDPAGPLFESQDPRARLDQSDAEFVDVIHSNGENLILGGLGSWQPMGHVDFYPNGGRMQKGCTNLFLGAVTDIIWSTAVEGRSLCNHRRAYKFFTDSIHPRCQFPAFPCNTYDDFIAGQCYPCNDARECGNMGYYADRAKGRGQLYLITRDEEPFCAHQYLIKIESSPADVPITSYGRIQVTLIGDSLLNETFILTKKEDEEMRLGDSISRIIVPHPVLLPPTNIQVLYHSYSGWLTSGLLQWKIDKITLSDSYGKSVSVCRKNLILDSGTSVILPLYPGNCNLPQTNEEQEAEDRNDDKNRTKFIPNLNEEGKNISKPRNDSLDNLNIPWTNDKENALDSETETESSRALNTRIFKSGDKSEIIREIVEPILKTHSMKNGRSHDPNKEKPEITEPILGPTTTRNTATTPPTAHFKVSDAPSKETVYNFYDIEKDSDWIPSVDPSLKKSEKWKREDDAKVVSSISHSKPQIKSENGFEAIVKTVQFLPQRIARMLEDAEKYARETVLPFVSTFTPRFITDFINPRPPPQQKYVPLSYEEATTNKIRTTPTLRRHITTSAPTTIFTMINQSKDEGSNKITSNEVTTVNLIRKQSTENNEITTTKKIQDGNGKFVKTTTPYTHIQKIKKKSEKIVEVFPENSDRLWMNSQISVKHDGRSVRENKAESSKSIVNEKSAKRSVKKEIYIDLPVFEDDNKIKYIPLIPDQSR